MPSSVVVGGVLGGVLTGTVPPVVAPDLSCMFIHL
jgi:hypothetical protein